MTQPFVEVVVGMRLSAVEGGGAGHDEVVTSVMGIFMPQVYDNNTLDSIHQV